MENGSEGRRHTGRTAQSGGGIWSRILKSRVESKEKAEAKWWQGGGDRGLEGVCGGRRESQRAGKGEQEGGVKWGGGGVGDAPFRQPHFQEPPCPLQAPAKEAARAGCVSLTPGAC